MLPVRAARPSPVSGQARGCRFAQGTCRYEEEAGRAGAGAKTGHHCAFVTDRSGPQSDSGARLALPTTVAPHFLRSADWGAKVTLIDRPAGSFVVFDDGNAFEIAL